MIRLPRVVIGAPDSWSQTVSISGVYLMCTWSPCGRFVAARTLKAVEIRSQLTFELLTVLKPCESPPFGQAFAYSPDGHSLACACADTVILIWDVQTGGVAKEIENGLDTIHSMVWSLDGRIIGVADYKAMCVRTYDADSGTMLFQKQLSCNILPPLWACQESVRFVTLDMDDLFLGVFEIGHTLDRICPLHFPPGVAYQYNFPRSTLPRSTISPTTYRLLNYDRSHLHVHQSSTPDALLDQNGYFDAPCFSSDGGFLAAFNYDDRTIVIWKYDSGCYVPWKKFTCRRGINSLRFSPTSSSILGNFVGGVLQVWRLDDPLIAPEACRQEYTGLSRSSNHLITANSNHLITANESEEIVTVTNIHTQVPSQLIDTGLKIKGLVVTNGVLLVTDSETTVAWLLTGEGVVDGVFGGRRADRSDSIWTIQLPCSGHKAEFKLKGQVAAIKRGKDICVLFHTETGEVLQPDQKPKRFDHSWEFFGKGFCGLDYLDLYKPRLSPKDSQKILPVTLRDGWVEDSNRRRRLWMPVEWRESDEGHKAEWRQSIMIHFGARGDKPAVIKFQLRPPPFTWSQGPCCEEYG